MTELTDRQLPDMYLNNHLFFLCISWFQAEYLYILLVTI